eukprot:1645206-Prymnesium_polylepis.1
MYTFLWAHANHQERPQLALSMARVVDGRHCWMLGGGGGGGAAVAVEWTAGAVWRQALACTPYESNRFVRDCTPNLKVGAESDDQVAHRRKRHAKGGDRARSEAVVQADHGSVNAVLEANVEHNVQVVCGEQVRALELVCERADAEDDATGGRGDDKEREAVNELAASRRGSIPRCERLLLRARTRQLGHSARASPSSARGRRSGTGGSGSHCVG